MKQDNSELVANLMLDTLKEHGRDYDNSKTEIIDFFMALVGGRQKLNCKYKVGEIIEYRHRYLKKDGYISKRGVWWRGRIVELRGAADWNKWTPREMFIKLDNGQSRLLDNTFDWDKRVRKIK